ncbi:unnamed protein product [Rhizoctonia solani]|uniref:MI domain-containing protein n=1 Tax=Rhizoctonia solani TaxID=456999 RepID=A0A8H3DNC5_9AGAM|nr:unnamed protein product [Rhizoctonia solani]
MELKLGAMLIKLEEGDFDDISDRIIEWLNKSEKEEGRKAIIKIAKLICERVKETETFGKTYARLCRKIMEQISPSIQDESIQNSEGKPLTGGMLFRKCLLNQCQEGFERRWSAEIVAPDANNVVDCRGPGLVLFIAELFKLQILTERIVHDCIKKLLSNVVDPEEEDIQKLCKLFKAIGHCLDNLNMKNHMDVYFQRMQGMANRSNNFRIHLMLSNVIELRARHRRAHSAIRRRVREDNSRASGFEAPANQVANFAPIVPLEQSESRWVAWSTQRKSQRVEVRQLVDRKVKALLNKLTMEKFDLISDQIIQWANKSEREKDGSTLMQVIKLVFEKAKDEATFSEMYARLCRKMMERVSPNVQDETMKNSEGQPITGGMLFRKYLLNRCQEDFERGWSAKEAALAAAALRSGEDKGAGAAFGDSGKAVFLFDEYYAAATAKRQGLGLVQFIGELFKLQMLTERIMHECIKKLLSNVVDPEEEEIESLCKLLTTVGQSLDNPKARNHMDIYFERMQDMAKSSNINSRMQFMLLDVIELRARHWQPRVSHSPPTHQDSSRGGSRRGGHSDNSREPGGWNVAGGASASRPSVRAGDLSQFGKISKPRGIQFGPSSVFNKRESSNRDSSIGRAGSASMFSALSSGVADRTSSGRGPSVNVGLGVFPASSGMRERKKIILQPKTVMTVEAVNEADIEEEREEAMTEEEAGHLVKEDVKEYLGVENVDEAIMALEALPSEHRHLFVDKLINASMDGGNKDVVLTEKLFSAARSQSVITTEDFERGMLPTIEMADDLSIDVPKTYEWLARMIHAAGLDKAKAEEMAGKISVYGEPRVPPRATTSNQHGQGRRREMESPASRQDEFSFRLAQWLLDQLHSEEELKTVTQQFNVLISQAQRESIEQLYLHIGRLIFQKFTRTNSQSTQLCAQLCRSLFIADLKPRSQLSTRPVPIHEHLFQCCLNDLSVGDSVQSSGTQQAASDTDESSPTQPKICADGAPPGNDENRIVEISFLVLELHRRGLVSAAQVYEYIFQLTTRLDSNHTNSVPSAIYTLLDGCFLRLDASLWKVELEHVYDWAKNLSLDTDMEQGCQEGVKQLTNLLNQILNREQGPETNSEDPGPAFERLSISVTAQPISSVQDDDEQPPNLNNIAINLGEIVYSPLTSIHEESSDGTGNNFGDYMHEAGSVDSLDSLKKPDEAGTSPGLNAGTHRPKSKRYGHVIHPFAIVDPSQPEVRPTRPAHLYPQHHFSSSESSFSSAGSASTHALPLSSPSPSSSPLPSTVASLILNKRQNKERLVKVVETQAEQDKKAKERHEKPKRSREDTVLD